MNYKLYIIADNQRFGEHTIADLGLSALKCEIITEVEKINALTDNACVIESKYIGDNSAQLRLAASNNKNIIYFVSNQLDELLNKWKTIWRSLINKLYDGECKFLSGTDITELMQSYLINQTNLPIRIKIAQVNMDFMIYPIGQFSTGFFILNKWI